MHLPVGDLKFSNFCWYVTLELNRRKLTAASFAHRHLTYGQTLLDAPAVTGKSIEYFYVFIIMR